MKVYNFLKPPLKIWICKLPVTSKRVITENIVRMIILLINNQNVKDKGYDLKGGMSAMASPNDEIVKGIDGIYSNKNPNSNIRYVINESRLMLPNYVNEKRHKANVG